MKTYTYKDLELPIDAIIVSLSINQYFDPSVAAYQTIYQGLTESYMFDTTNVTTAWKLHLKIYNDTNQNFNGVYYAVRCSYCLF